MFIGLSLHQLRSRYLKILFLFHDLLTKTLRAEINQMSLMSFTVNDFPSMFSKFTKGKSGSFRLMDRAYFNGTGFEMSNLYANMNLHKASALRRMGALIYIVLKCRRLMQNSFVTLLVVRE